MTHSVKAAVVEAPETDGFTVTDVELDDPKPGEVRLEIEYAGACHTDWHAVEGALQRNYPVVAGHEGAGRVVEIGEGVTSVEPGDRALTLWVPSCGACEMCVQGHQHLCVRGGESLYEGYLLDGTCRFHRGDEDLAQFLTLGTFAEEIVVPESEVYPIPNVLPTDVASIIGCGVVTGYGSAAHRADIQPNDTVVVIGAGNVGLNAIQGATHAGAGTVIASDLVDLKREKSLEFGADYAIDPDVTDPVEFVHDIAPLGADVVVLSVGVASGELIADTVPLLGPRGELIITAGSPSRNIPISPQQLLDGETEIKGCLYGGASPRRTTAEVIDRYLNDDYLLDELITQEYCLDDVDKAYANLLDGEDVHSVLKLR
ncbi:alcohol dehydrogenase catalytic domain-containing protein [Halosolutus gelatinilyticus]|uniref:alcohol dehydrogenase catalytic domain-containing protein n=1 Tax=Halosolutus gelatinilyticus TaxID=2931975 RepID=UPI001FF229A5|nr:alcohol dehydrogenase catalytic domain-containing protein [Halosolutus gelatinilyticus]